LYYEVGTTYVNPWSSAGFVVAFVVDNIKYIVDVPLAFLHLFRELDQVAEGSGDGEGVDLEEGEELSRRRVQGGRVWGAVMQEPRKSVWRTMMRVTGRGK